MDLIFLTEEGSDLESLKQKAKQKAKLFGFPFFIVKKKGDAISKYILIAAELFHKWAKSKQDDYERVYPEART